MQPVFFDIPAGAFSRNSMLQEWVQDGYAVTGRLRRSGYDRVKLLAEQPADIYDLMETVTFQESVHWILQEECSHYRELLEPGDYVMFRQQAKRRMEKMEPQLRLIIRQDIAQRLKHNDTFNIHGYLRFAAQKLKQMQQNALQEEYQRLAEELEQESFIELLRFFVAVQPPVLKEAHLTMTTIGFTLTDEWGNDLKRIYLESFLEEDIAISSDNDLILSILITLLPQRVVLSVPEPPESRDFLWLLQQVFGERLVISL